MSVHQCFQALWRKFISSALFWSETHGEVLDVRFGRTFKPISKFLYRTIDGRLFLQELYVASVSEGVPGI